jgi:hypothetical protein
MKTKVDGITVSIGKAPKPSVYIHRGYDCNLYIATPSSLRRAQRAQWALMTRGQAE